jgi:hypothetical protein
MIRPISAALCAIVAAAMPLFAQPMQGRPGELDRLNNLVGVFEGEVRVERANAAPITGWMKYQASWDLDSAWVIARYEQTLMGQRTSGLLLYSFDNGSKRYVFYGFPNSPMAPHQLTGSFAGHTLTFEADAPNQGRQYRETWERVGADTLVTVLSAFQDGAWVAGPRTVLVRSARVQQELRTAGTTYNKNYVQ